MKKVKKNNKVSFHGGCCGCTQQDKNGVDFCYNCQYFDAEWEKPDLNNSPETEAEKVRKEVKRRMER